VKTLYIIIIAFLLSSCVMPGYIKFPEPMPVPPSFQGDHAVEVGVMINLGRY
jgi:hypothetical protein